MMTAYCGVLIHSLEVWYNSKQPITFHFSPHLKCCQILQGGFKLIEKFARVSNHWLSLFHHGIADVNVTPMMALVCAILDKYEDVGMQN